MEKEHMVDVRYLAPEARGILEDRFLTEMVTVWRSRTKADSDLQDKILLEWASGRISLRVPLEIHNKARNRILGY